MKRIKLSKNVRFSQVTMTFVGDPEMNEIIFEVSDKDFKIIEKLCKGKDIEVTELKEVTEEKSKKKSKNQTEETNADQTEETKEVTEDK